MATKDSKNQNLVLLKLMFSVDVWVKITLIIEIIFSTDFLSPIPQKMQCSKTL